MMMVGLSSYLRFHCMRMLRAQPAVVTACAGALLCVLLTAFAFLQAQGAASSARLEFAQLRKPGLRKPDLPSKAVEPNISVAPLPWFRSAELVERFGNAAADNGLSLDEVGYLLEAGTNRPYLRYRVTMTLIADYPAIRRFVTDVTTTMAHVDLDSINCTRSDILVAPLTCELAFSAFFRTDTHG